MSHTESKITRGMMRKDHMNGQATEIETDS